MPPAPTTPDHTSADVQTVALVSLGCPKNLVDSEKMLGLLAEDGVTPVPSDDPADAVIINTCGFLEASKEESLGEIHDALARKAAGEVKRVVVAGCLVQRHRAKILDWAPGVDALIGVYDRDKVIEAVRGPSGTAGRDAAVELPVFSSIAASATLAKQARAIADSDETGGAVGYFESDATRLRLTPRHYAYLRMSEGCNQNCAFCTIPSIRGKMRSKPMPAILTELRELMHDGAFEINLIGQDTTSYGDDIGYAPGLTGLLTELSHTVDNEFGAGGAWLRLMYAYPSCFTDEMIDAIASLPNVVKYIDMPLQHINDEVLDRMRRKTSRKLIETLLAKLRDRVPGIAIRTTMISGFPGETDAQHDELVTFLGDFGFDHMGVFPYSPEPGTPAGTLHAAGDAVPDDVIASRIDELMSTQQRVVFDRNAAWVDAERAFDCLVDDHHGENEDGRQVYLARAPHQAPDIDSTTYLLSRDELSPGEVVHATVIGADGYDLIAEATETAGVKVRLPLA